MLLAPVIRPIGNATAGYLADGGLHYLPFAALPVPAARSSTDASSGPSGSQKLTERLSRQPWLLITKSSACHRLLLSQWCDAKQRVVSQRPNWWRSSLTRYLPRQMFASGVVRLMQAKPEQSSAGSNTTGLKGLVEETGLAGGKWPPPRLLGTRREAKAILSLAPSQTSKQAIDFDASRETAIGDDLSQYQIVHFATHGLINNRHPNCPAWCYRLLTNRVARVTGSFGLTRYTTCDCPAELVVLSACQTGLGKDSRRRTGRSDARLYVRWSTAIDVELVASGRRCHE